MGQKNNTIILWLSAFLDLLINLSTIFVVFLLMYKRLAGFGKVQMTVAIVFVLFTSLCYFYASTYNLKRFEKLRIKLLRSFIAQLVSYIVALIFLTVFKTFNAPYYAFASICYGASLVLIVIKKIITTKLVHIFRTKRSNDREILIVGAGDGAKAYADQLSKNLHFGYNIIGCVCDGDDAGIPKLGEISELDEVIKRHNPFEVVIALDSANDEKMQEILHICDANGVRALIVPITYKYFKSKCQVDMIGELPIINTRAIPLDNVAYAALKRLMDIVISFIMIVITLPVMIIAALGVKLSSKGPVIFKQKRVGKNNKIFTMYKFRSMRVNDESDTAWTTDNDPRKTRFGTFMRKTGIDELPQLFNVLFGSMSIIGPRPEIPTYVEKYSKTVPLYRVKHQVKPGITGLAQIYGFRGDTSIEKRIELDIEYIENWSLFNDFKILIITPFKMFNRNEKYEK